MRQWPISQINGGRRTPASHCRKDRCKRLLMPLENMSNCAISGSTQCWSVAKLLCPFFRGVAVVQRAQRCVVRTMSRKLSDEDRRAVDLFLDQGAEAANVNVTQVVPLVAQKRMSSVAKILTVLVFLAAATPQPNLIAINMRRIH